MSVYELFFDVYGGFVIVGMLILFFHLWINDSRKRRNRQQQTLDEALWTKQDAHMVFFVFTVIDEHEEGEE